MPPSSDVNQEIAPVPVSDSDPLRRWRTGDTWTNATTGMHLLVERSAVETDGASTVWQVTYPPSSTRPPLHLHPRQRERFTLLSGRMRIVHRSAERELIEGETLEIAPGETHAMWNASADRAVVRWETTPALQTERWMAMLIALAAAGRTNAQGVPRLLQLAVLLRAHRGELRLYKPPSVLQHLIFIPASWLGRMLGLRADRIDGRME